MENKTKIFIIIGCIVLVIVAVVVAAAYSQLSTKDYTDFAKCLTNKGAIFYGSFLCPHCLDQKAMFGQAVKYLNYVECSTPDGKDLSQICKDKNIESWPTWVFSDGSTIVGETDLKNLADKTGCQLPK